MIIENRDALLKEREAAQKEIDAYKCRILVCAGTGCVASGSEKIYNKMLELCQDLEGVSVEFQKDVPHIGAVKTGCQGICELGPLVRIEPCHYQYVKVQEEDCQEIFQRTVLKQEPVERLFYKKNGESYATPDVLEEVDQSKLRGRGGGGFPAGRKWKQVAAHKDVPEHFVVCNGDEGDPGAFMDGSVMEGDPYRLIEGMTIAAYATGAQNGYIYVRAEYPLSVARLRHAIRQAEEKGLLGNHILGTDFSFHMHINRGAGAFVCGEGSALTASIEGDRGMPRTKPPRTVDQGLWAKPTVLNNVETFANVPGIILKGAQWFRTIGTEGSPGTKTFSITGSIENTGLIEVPMGTTLREIIYDIGGGIKGGGDFKAIQIGGPSGGCLTSEHLDVGLDFDNVKKYNAIMGSGGLVVMDENTCMVEVARFFMSFTQRESCGKCVPCREGTKRMLEILERIVNGEGKLEDLDTLEELASMVKGMALCGLGKSAPLPVISTLKTFRKEYEEHILEHKCAAKSCTAMRRYIINPEFCKGCGKCAKNCPVGAITGVRKETYHINPNLCIKCDSCRENCAFDAVYVEY